MSYPPRLAWVVLALIFTLGLTACSVPKHMRVRSGMHPDYQDEQVRFRTIYYFRVKNPCHDENDGIQQDSLYRFRMTGKASALADKIKFESGTLHKDQIDPFGKSVVPGVIKTAPKLSKQMELAAALAKIRNNFDQPDAWTQANVDNVKQKLEGIKSQTNELYAGEKLRNTRIESALGNLKSNLQLGNGETAITDTDKKANIRAILTLLVEDLGPPLTPHSENCNPPSNRQGFQIWGPQGWVTFDQDQRLLMAMTTSAKPLTSVMQEYSARVIGRQGKFNDADALLPLIREQLHLSRAELALNSENASDTTAAQLVERVIEAFGDKGGAK